MAYSSLSTTHTHTHTHEHQAHTYTFTYTLLDIHKTIGAPAAASDIYSFAVDPVGLDPRLFLCDGGRRNI